MKKEDAENGREEKDRCYDLSTTGRSRHVDSPTSKQQVMLREFCLT